MSKDNGHEYEIFLKSSTMLTMTVIPELPSSSLLNLSESE